MNLEKTARKLKNIPLFANMEPSKLKLLAFASDQLTFEDGEEICHMGDPADSAYFIEDGAVDVIIEKEGKSIKVNELGSNTVFGEMGLFLSSGRSATIAARGRLTVMKIDGDIFLKMVTENPEAALGIMKSLSEKIATTSAQIASGAFAGKS
ncbi:MAG TPA: cyclic nucleotide-binding domain-containing protein [Rhizobiales bacterium]|nr:cyclic nucleotide-binding domain-containing protein [Hyphomicrobiales bacterium]